MSELLREKNPDLAETCDRLKEVFEGDYKFSESGQVQRFVEGAEEYAKLMATTATTGNVSVTVGPNGIEVILRSLFK